MAHYVDGFVIPLPKKHLNAYRRLAQKAGELWRHHWCGITTNIEPLQKEGAKK